MAVNKTFNVKHILGLTLCVALLIPYLVAVFKPRPQPEQFDFDVHNALLQTLVALDPEVLTGGGHSFNRYRSSYECERELAITTKLEDRSAIFERALKLLDKKIEREQWSVTRSGGTAEFRWFRLKKNETICLFQIWLGEHNQESHELHLPDAENHFMIGTSCYGFQPAY